MIQGDYTELLGETFIEDGWGSCEKINLRGLGKLNIFGRRGNYKAVVSLLKIRGDFDEPFMAIQRALDDFFNKHGVYPELIFQGAPNGLPFPDWFSRYLHNNGIHNSIISVEEILMRAREKNLLKLDRFNYRNEFRV